MSDIESDRPVMLSDLRALETEIASGSELLASTLRAEIAAGDQMLRDEITKQSEEDRRHFKMLAEDVKNSVRIVAEGTAHNAARLADHETRLQKVEERR